MRGRSLYKYFTERKWAEAFLSGGILCRSLAYFRDYEDNEVRGDRNEGNAIYHPQPGLLVNNLSKRRDVNLLGWAFESTVRQEEIFVHCLSRIFDASLAARFGQGGCVEVCNVPRFLERVEKSLPEKTTFTAGRVIYSDEKLGPETRWALPDEIVLSKLRAYEWQREFRFAFCFTDALEFEKASYRLIRREEGSEQEAIVKQPKYPEYLIRTSSLDDVCKLHDTETV
jgi:hypothetical protein